MMTWFGVVVVEKTERGKNTYIYFTCIIKELVDRLDMVCRREEPKVVPDLA